MQTFWLSFESSLGERVVLLCRLYNLIKTIKPSRYQEGFVVLMRSSFTITIYFFKKMENIFFALRFKGQTMCEWTDSRVLFAQQLIKFYGETSSLRAFEEAVREYFRTAEKTLMNSSALVGIDPVDITTDACAYLAHLQQPTYI